LEVVAKAICPLKSYYRSYVPGYSVDYFHK